MSAITIDGSPPVVIGIDPGLSGAVAVLSLKGDLLHVEDMPVADKRVMARLLPRPLQPDAVQVVGIELVASRPLQGVASTFKFGASWGAVHGYYGGVGCPIVDVLPRIWKKHFGIRGESKDQKEKALRLATERWPDMADRFARKKDAGRAEAALIGLYLIEKGET